jgi:phenylacetate-CoA ligase
MIPLNQKFIKLANQTFKTVPAYTDLLKRHGFRKRGIKSQDDFFQLPITDKNNYLQKNSFPKLISKKQKLPIAYASSGSSGKPSYWFRSKKQEISGGEIHETIIRDIFQIKKEDKVLIIICFSMGIWVAGNYTLECFRWISEQGYNITTITPGIEKHDILNILKNLAPNFEKTILAGYPSFVMDILVETKKQKISLTKNFKILTAGDSFSEKWREEALKYLSPNTNITDIISIYGSADLGVMGFETPLSIFTRTAAANNKLFKEKLFGINEKLPALVQFKPDYIYIESVKNELVLTADTAIPLIRYNIHDAGEIISFTDMIKLLKRFKLFNEAKKLKLTNWKLPFIIKNGRTDVAVTYYALNIYPEHIEAGLKNSEFSKSISGNFKAYNETVRNEKKENLIIEVEVKENFKNSNKTLEKISSSVLNSLIKLNIEFRKLYNTLGTQATPKIKLVKNIIQNNTASTKTLLYISGKKPKIVF